MKPIILVSAQIFLLLMCLRAVSQENVRKDVNPKNGKVIVSCTPDLEELALKWATEYSRINPGAKISILQAGNNNPVLGADENLSFVSYNSQNVNSLEGNWKLPIGRDVIVPVFNANNPFKAEISKQGISQIQFTQIFKTPAEQNWGILLAGGQSAPIHIFMTDNETIKTSVAKFLQLTQIPEANITLGTKEQVIAAIQKDPYAIGFCNVVDILKPDKQTIMDYINVLPIDKNANGALDHMEDFYSNMNIFLRGVWIGKYPKSLYSNIYVVSKVQPSNDVELNFLSWILTDGQQYMNTSGFCSLNSSESQSQLAILNNTTELKVAPVEETSQTGIILLVLALLLISGLISSVVIRNYRKQKSLTPDISVTPVGFDETTLSVPNGLYFDKSHTWAFMEKDGNITIGIDDFLQHITGPITRVDMKNPGEKIRKGDLLFSIIQSGKKLSLFAPISGVIKKQNEALMTNGTLINTSPYSNGWVYIIEPANWFQEIQFLNMAEKHSKWLNTEFSRVKDFFAASFKPGSLEYSHIVLQDGGQLKDGILADFGPEIWEDFQTNFLDNYK